jgi:hypothetical protein
MRDTLKSKEYFEKCIAYERDQITKFSSMLATVDISNERGIHKGKLFLGNFYNNLMKLSYSIGDTIDEVYKYYIMHLQYYKEVCSPNDSTYDIIDILSIGVLFFERRQEFLVSLREILEKFNSADGLIINLMNYLENDPIHDINSKFEYFNELLKNDNKQSVLNDELKLWYKQHKVAYWYNSHESKNDTYCGYWCFEIAALAKIFSVDDSEFKSHPYYPYDLAHQ